MSSKASQLPEKPAIITVIGAGFTGGAIALQQLRHYVAHYKQGGSLPPLAIRLIDQAGTFGTDECLDELLAKTFAAAAADNIPITLEQRADEIVDIAPHAGGLLLAAKHSSTLETQALVLATEPAGGTFLQSLEASAQSFAIVSTQNMPAALAVLEHAGYAGKIYALSRNLVLPCSFDPAFYRKPLPPYKPLYLDPERVRKADDQSAEGLERRFKLEVRRAHERGYGVAHVLNAIDFAALATTGPHGTPPAGLQALCDIKDAPAQQRYLDSGRLMLVKEVRAVRGREEAVVA